jgi:hypothetical protein
LFSYINAGMTNQTEMRIFPVFRYGLLPVTP